MEKMMNDDLVQESIKLLSMNGFQTESKSLYELTEILDTMNTKYHDLLVELQEVKNSLVTLENAQSKSFATKAIESLDNRIQTGKAQVIHMIDHVKDVTKDTVQSYKSKGKDVLLASINKLKIKPMIGRLHKSLYFSLNEINVCISKFDHMTSELRQAKQHVRNLSSIMFGKKLPLHAHDTDKVNGIQNLLRSMKTKNEKMITKTANMIHRLNDFDKGSVKAELKLLSNKHGDNQSNGSLLKSIESNKLR